MASQIKLKVDYDEDGIIEENESGQGVAVVTLSQWTNQLVEI
jgi:hypothetical protein